MKVVLLPIGSGGDVFPMMGLGERLKSRGHDVVMMTSAAYRDASIARDFDFFELLSLDEYNAVVGNPDLWHPVKSFRVLFRGAVMPAMRRAFEAINNVADDETVLVAHMRIRVLPRSNDVIDLLNTLMNCIAPRQPKLSYKQILTTIEWEVVEIVGFVVNRCDPFPWGVAVTKCRNPEGPPHLRGCECFELRRMASPAGLFANVDRL